VGARDGVKGDLHSKFAVECQEGLQDVLLAPGPALIDDPSARVFVRQKDVVDVDPHARGQPRQKVEEDPVHIAAGLDRVRRVDEQHVAGLERSCYLSGVQPLAALLMDHGAFERTKRARGRHAERVWVIEVVLARAVALERGVDEVAGRTRTELDDERRLQMPDERVEDFRVTRTV
jgi:hypothetical protein